MVSATGTRWRRPCAPRVVHRGRRPHAQHETATQEGRRGLRVRHLLERSGSDCTSASRSNRSTGRKPGESGVPSGVTDDLGSAPELPQAGDLVVWVQESVGGPGEDEAPPVRPRRVTASGRTTRTGGLANVTMRRRGSPRARRDGVQTRRQVATVNRRRRGPGRGGGRTRRRRRGGS